MAMFDLPWWWLPAALGVAAVTMVVAFLVDRRRLVPQKRVQLPCQICGRPTAVLYPVMKKYQKAWFPLGKPQPIDPETGLIKTPEYFGACARCAAIKESPDRPISDVYDKEMDAEPMPIIYGKPLFDLKAPARLPPLMDPRPKTSKVVENEDGSQTLHQTFDVPPPLERYRCLRCGAVLVGHDLMNRAAGGESIECAKCSVELPEDRYRCAACGAVLTGDARGDLGGLCPGCKDAGKSA